MRVLVLDGVSEKAVNILFKGGIEAVINNKKMSEAELCDIIREYDGVIVRSATKITANVIATGTNLKIIGRAGVGVDNIDIPAATNAGIIVVNAPDGNKIAATEQTLALMLGLARNLPQAHKDLKEGKWMRQEYMGVELRNKILGIIGLGRIGTSVAKRALAFEMKIIGYDPMVSPEAAAAHGIILKSLEEVISTADFLTLHIPKTKESMDMINKDTIGMMKNGAMIINVARGGIINEEDLYEACKNGKLAGAALDVFAVEPTTESPLFELNNVIVAPHLGASTQEAQVNVALDVAEEFVNILVKGEIAKNAVNLAPIKPSVLAAIKPYMVLAEKIGKFQSQLASEGIKSVKITYSGELAQVDSSPLTLAFLKGFFEPMVEESGSVNYVNAPILAKERGIVVDEIKTSEAGNYTAMISATVESDVVRDISGTLFGSDDPRIVQIDKYRVDVVPAGHILVIPHQDKPKITGPVTMIIGENNINIAGMQVGRKTIGGNAIVIMAVDNLVSDAMLAEIRQIEGVHDVKMVTL